MEKDEMEKELVRLDVEIEEMKNALKTLKDEKKDLLEIYMKLDDPDQQELSEFKE